MTTSTLQIPEFYNHWLGTAPGTEWFGEGGAPCVERGIDCTACMMLKPRGLTRDLGPFLQNLKCCTYHPYLPSFTIGALAETGENRSILYEYLRLSRLTPLGSYAKRARQLMYDTSICETGRHEKDRCWFLEKNDNPKCTIWKHRPSTCAGYVCLLGSDGGASIKKWETRLAEFEVTLAHAAAYELGLTNDDLKIEFKSIDAALEYFNRAYQMARNIRLSPQGHWKIAE